MTTIEIKHRYTRAVLWSGEAESLREAVVTAVRAGANLADAYLADAYLDASLTGAYLADALEASFGLNGSRWAGAAIYRASTGRAPHFFANNRDALEDIRRCAAEDLALAEAP